MHQGSVLGPLLFILVLVALSRLFRTGMPWEYLYADGLVLIMDIEEECISKLCVNRKKTKFLLSTMMSSRNLVSNPVLPAVVVLVAPPFCAHSACRGSTRSAVLSLSDWWPTQTISAPV